MTSWKCSHSQNTEALVSRYFSKFHNFNRKIPVLESLLTKLQALEAYKFIKKRLQHRCFPVKNTFFCRTRPVAVSKNTQKIYLMAAFLQYCQLQDPNLNENVLHQRSLVESSRRIFFPNSTFKGYWKRKFSIGF